MLQNNEDFAGGIMTGKLYGTYIFDYYGTLVDIKTDEGKKDLWKKLAGIYAAYGADYTGKEIHEFYDRLCADETNHVKKVMGVWHPDMQLDFPEIQLDRVFARLLVEAPRHHETRATIDGKQVRLLSVEEIAQSEWVYMLSNMFRVLSRERLSAYPNTIKTMQFLKKKGCKLYLLSNAQGSFTRVELEMTGVLDYLDGVYISSDKQIRKPQPEFLRSLIEQFNVDTKEAVMVGNDMQSDMGIASACGIPGIFLNTFGWDDEKIEEERKLIPNADLADITIVKNGDIGFLMR